jgi:predicted permease
MAITTGLRARVRSMFGRAAAESRMEEEFRFHIEMETARLVREGLPPEEARRRASVTFGGLDQYREAMRDGRGARWFDDLRADLRYALRGMRRRPGFAVATAITLGIGVGLNGVVFGYVNSLLFRPVPARAPQQLVSLFSTDSRSGQPQSVGYEDYLDFRDRSGVFAGLAGMMGTPLNLVVPGAGTERASDMVWGEMVTENYFSVLDMRPAHGRFFTANDAPPGANPFVVVSHESWEKRFLRDPRIAGTVVRINGTAFTVTGVAPKGFRGMRTFGFWPEMWVPVGMHAIVQPGSSGLTQGRGGGWMMTVGRMHAGWDRRRTEIAAAAFARQLEQSYAATNAGVGAMLIPARVGFDSPAFVKPKVLALASALGVFASLITLLIICANLANLQLARAAERSREIAIRLSLGGSRGRLMRQLFIESAVLAAPGLAIAMALPLLTPVLEPYLTPRLQFQVGLGAGPDHRVMLFTGAIAVIGVILFGFVPALRASRADLATSLSSVVGAARRSVRKPMRLRAFLVVSQLALSVILLVGGGLFVRSLILARASDPGFDPRNRALLSVNVGLQGYDEARGRAFYDAVVARVRATPGVVSAAWAFPVPFDTYGRGVAVYVDGAATNSDDGTVGTDASYVSEDFMRALGLRMETGRDFNATVDTAGAPRTLIVSRRLATRLWPGKDPVGQRARLGNAQGPEMTVIGVVADAKFASLGDASTSRAYLSMRQRYRDWETLIVHTGGAASRILPQLERIVADRDPMLPVFGVTTMEESVRSGLATSRSAARIAGFFGLLGLLIASVGLYAVVASSVAERTREIGLRMALGATPVGAMRHVMRSGARLGVIGLAVGLIGAALVARLMAGLLVGLSPSDPVTFAAVPLTLALVVLIATYLPARRVTRLDPVAALRTD